jgi:hypothetical protein
MPSVVRCLTGREFIEIIGMRICNKAALFIELIFIVVLIFVFVYFGFDIEELIAAFTPALSPVALRKVSIYVRACVFSCAIEGILGNSVSSSLFGMESGVPFQSHPHRLPRHHHLGPQ